MAGSTRMRLKSEQHAQNIEKRGLVPSSRTKREQKFPVGPVLLALFLFVVVGSALLQIVKTAMTKSE